MAKILVEKPVCKGCAAEIRAGSHFCYNCGMAVPAKDDGPFTEDPGHSRPRTSENSNAETNNHRNTNSVNERSAVVDVRRTGTSGAALAETKDSGGEIQMVGNPALRQKAELRPAGGMRNRVKAYNRRPIEVEWVEREGSPARFVVISIVLTLFAGLMLFLAFYLR